jgi:hypothetical protein
LRSWGKHRTSRRARGKEGSLDLAQSHADWADKLARTLGVPLAEVAPSAWHAANVAHDPRGAEAPGAVPADLALHRAAQRAVALAQQEKSDGRLVSVINAPAGSGKTRVLAEIARAWQGAGLGPVIGITAAQSARNTLAVGGIESFNSAQFLGHLPGRRGARGPMPIAEGTLLAVDEASMMPGPDLADLITLAETHGGKVVLAGDISQLQAVQNGGGMSLLADRLGYVRLAEPVRFRQPWEQAASLRLRDGDTTVLADYDQHARITGGDPEQMMDAATAAYVALTTGGTDVLLMAAGHSLRRELSRRIRDDLIHLGYVSPGPTVTIAGGTRASCGDLIVCTRNEHEVEAGERGRMLANGDLLRIQAVTRGGLLVRRALDADPETGRRRWTDRQFLYANFQESELGYAVTDHAAQGRTVHTGLAVFTGTEDRQHAYVALTRGTDENAAYVFTVSPKRADIAPGLRPAPELARYDRLAAREHGPRVVTARAAGEEAAGMLAEVIGRDGRQRSASQTRRQALADADHLALLHTIWTAETSRTRHQRYQELLTAALPPGHQQEPSHQAQWLWRTLRAAELAGLDARQVLADAVAERDLTGARDIAAVIDARIRRRAGALVPLPAGPWSAQVPDIADSERRAYTAEIAALMDARKERIGEHAAANHLPWAVTALGPVPADPAARLDWEQRAASVGAYRELSGYGHPTDPIGPEPATGTPDLRAAWHEALTALGPVDGPDVRGMPDGRLLHLRDTYPIETAWAPPWTGYQLRQARTAARDAYQGALRATAEATVARNRGDHEQASRQQTLAASYQAMGEIYREREAAFAATLTDRADWERATCHQRQLAIAADTELRRRHPDQPWPPLRSAEPELAAPAAQPRDPFPTPEQGAEQAAEELSELAARHREFADKLAQRQSLEIPAEDLDYENHGPAFPALEGLHPDAILQPPKPEIQLSSRILERFAERERDFEAGS